MSSNSFKVKNSLVLTPKDLSTLISPEAGDLACDINDSNKIKRYDAASASWVEVGSGGGVGGVDIFFVQDFESASLSSFTQTGLVLSQTDPLKGKVSAVLTHQAAINQSFKQIIPVDRKFRGESLTLSLDAKSSASQGNLVIKITNETASTDIVASEQLEISNDVSGAKSSVTFTIPESCASLSYTIIALPEAGSPVSRIDDIICQLTSVEVINSGLVQQMDSMVSVANPNGFGTTANKIRRFSIIKRQLGSDISYQDSPTMGASFTVLESGIYTISYGDEFNSVSGFGISLNSQNLTTIFEGLPVGERLMGTSTAANYNGEAVWTGVLSAGDVVRPHTTGAANGDTGHAYFIISRQGSLKQVTVNPNSKITIPTSELRMEGASTRGSTATAIVRFDNIAKIRGDAFEVLSDAVLGTRIVMKKAGKLDVSVACYSNAANSTFSVSKNQAILTGIATQSEIIATGHSITANSGGSGGSTYVNVGDIIRVSSTVNPTNTAPNFINLSFQEQEIQVSVSNTLPQFSESDTSIIVSGGSVGGNGQITGFSSVTQNIGVAASYASNSYTILEDGIFTLNASGALTTGTLATLAFSLNGTAMFGGTTPSGTATASAGTSITRYFTAGSVITLTNLGSGGVNGVQMSISKVGKPNVTGVDVTPFVNVPQPVSQFLSATGGSGANTIVSNFSGLSSTNNGIISQTASRLTALKRCNFSLFVRATSGGAGNRIDIYKNGSLYVTGITIGSGSMLNQVSLLANIGDYFEVYSLGAGGNTGISYEASAEALSDSILTAPESFSTDTASLTYAGSGTYTLSTLANAPVGTYITFTYAANTNTRTQTTTRPTQTDADMNANGIQLFTRAFNAASTAAQPAAIAIQIGKGLKGVTKNLYKSAGKVTAGNLDYLVIGTSADVGAKIYAYNELTGILVVDAGTVSQATVTTHTFTFSDDTAQTNGYLVINASKNPALTGFGLNRVAARATNTSGQTFSANDTIMTYNSTKIFDTHNALNTATGLFTAPESGYYLVEANAFFASRAYTPGVGIYIRGIKNGSYYNAGAINTITATYTGNAPAGKYSSVVYLAKGDTFGVSVWNDAGTASLFTSINEFNSISITKVSV